MSAPAPHLLALFAELRRRHVFRVAGVYAIVGWLVLQVTTTIAPLLDLPEWAPRLILLLLLLGCPVALVLAWAFELTPDGVRVTQPGDPAAAPPAAWPLHTWLSVGLVAVAMGGVAVYLGARPAPIDTEVKPRLESIAVLPFANLTGDPEYEFLGGSIAVELCSRLSRIRGLRVHSCTTSQQYRDGLENPRRTAEMLGVRHLLIGNVRGDAGQFRVQAELLDALANEKVWDHTHRPGLTDLMAMQEAIAHEVVSGLRLQLPEGDGAQAPKRETDPLAHLLYLKGRHAWNQIGDEGQAEQALRFFHQAIREDPDYAEAYAGLADTYVMLNSSGVMPADSALVAAGRAARKALELDGTLANAHTSLAAVLVWKGEFSEAARTFERAIELNPNYESAHHGYAMLLAVLGRKEDALREIRIAHDLLPTSALINQQYAMVLYLTGDYPGAIEQARRALELESDFPWALDVQGVAEAQLGRLDEAVRTLEQARRIKPGDPEILADLATVYARAGQTRRARELLQQLEHPSAGQPDGFRIAQVYAALGDTDKAFAWLDDVRWDVLSLVLIRMEPFLDPLREDPRYPKLLSRLRLD